MAQSVMSSTQRGVGAVHALGTKRKSIVYMNGSSMISNSI